MGYQSSDTPAFQEQVAKWIDERDEVLALIRFSRAGGAKSFEFFQRFAAFKQRLDELPPRSCVIVFGQRQLPLRGLVDDDLVGRALDLVADGAHYLITGLTKEVISKAAWFPEFDGMTHDEMNEDLEQLWSHGG